MITKANILAAAASIVMGPGGAVNFEAGCAISRTGTGTYNVLIDETQTVPPSVGFLMPAVQSAAISQPTVQHVSDTAGNGAQTLFTVTTLDLLGHLNDLPGSLGIKVIAVGGGNQGSPSQTGV